MKTIIITSIFILITISLGQQKNNDQIVKKDNSLIIGKVIRVTNENIELETTPKKKVVLVPKSEVKLIIYSNGSVLSFDEESKSNNYKTTIEGKFINTSRVRIKNWKSLEFKKNGNAIVNDGEFVNSYKINDNIITIQSGIVFVNGEIVNDTTINIEEDVFIIGGIDPSEIKNTNIAYYRDEAVRLGIVDDLVKLAAKAQEYYRKSVHLGGGGNSFIGLTADKKGLAKLDSPEILEEGKYIYAIATPGTNEDVYIIGTWKTTDWIMCSVLVKPNSYKISK